MALAALLAMMALALWYTAPRSHPGSWGVRHAGSQKLAHLVSQVRGQGKLVLATQTFSVDLHQTDSKYLMGLYLGQTIVRLRVDGCRVQYVIDGAQVRAEDLSYDPQARRLSLNLPRPVLDEALVEIPADPARWRVEKASGWARFDKDRMEANLRAELRQRVIELARQQGLDMQTELVARAALTELCRQLWQDPDLRVEIHWK